MGFSPTFMGVDRAGGRDADRAGLAASLERCGLVLAAGPAPHQLRSQDGRPLWLDGDPTDLHIDPLDSASPLTGGLWHATLGDQECAFVYDLCVAARWLIVNDQGEPTYVVPGDVNPPDTLPPDAEGDVAFVGSGSELQQALNGGFERFLDYRAHVIDG